jgi:single-strand DNA-binding protein
MEKASLNHVRLIGRIGQDPQVRSTPSGFLAANFSLATTESKQVPNTNPPQYQDHTEWHRCTCTGKKAELMQKIGKGAQLHVEGKLETRKFTDRNNQERQITEIKVQKITVLQWPNSGNQQGGGGYQQPQRQQQYPQQQPQQQPQQADAFGGGGGGYVPDDDPLPF